MSQNVSINLKTNHRSMEDGTEYQEDAVYNGIMQSQGSVIYISYDSKSEDGGLVTKNIIKLDGGQLVRTSKGETDSKIIFSKGHTTKTNYVTPFGNFDMSFLTKHLKIEQSVNVIRINLEYIMSLNGLPHEEIEMMIKVIMK